MGRISSNTAEIRGFIPLEIQRYDYIGIKIATGVATIEDYAEQIAHMEELRKQIRELEAKIEPNNYKLIY